MTEAAGPTDGTDGIGLSAAKGPAGASGARILMVEDDAATRSSVVANLVSHGYRVLEAADVATALRSWEAGRPDLILLDLGLPDGDGSTVIRRVRRDATTPILVLTARGTEPDKVTALEAGADDYVTKPFGLAELRARVAALLRRAGGPAADATGVLRLGPIAIDVARHEVAVGGTPLDLTPREYELLKTMVAQPGRLLTRGRLLRAVWGTAYSSEAHYLHVYVSRLRRKLDRADPTGSASGLIVAEPGVGYRIGENEARP
jgi:two-component system KDP operon response regulator KdpE